MTDVGPLLDHFFRQHYGPLVAGLTRWLGGQLDLAEEAVSEAMLRAMRAWPMHGIPDNPGGWLHRVARRCAIDQLRLRKGEQDVPELAAEPDVPTGEVLTDDGLRLVVLCCSVPGLSRPERVALTLQLAGGFGAAELARALRVPAATLAQRLVRAKRRLRELPPSRFALPAEETLGDQLDEVLDVLYLTFNEGYTPRDGDEVLRQEIADEAIRLVGLLLDQPFGQRPRVHALAALMLLQSSRITARVVDGALVPLEEQARGLWDRRRIALGLDQLALAADGEALSDYHVLADIAAVHATSPDAASTDWSRILSLYDALEDGGPVLAVGRAVAVGMVDGWGAALARLDDVRPRASYDEYVLAAARAECLRRLRRTDEASAAYRRAAELAPSEPERRFLLGRV